MGTFFASIRAIHARNFTDAGMASMMPIVGFTAYEIARRLNATRVYGTDAEVAADDVLRESVGLQVDDNGDLASIILRKIIEAGLELAPEVETFMQKAADRISNPRAVSIGEKVKSIKGTPPRQ